MRWHRRPRGLDHGQRGGRRARSAHAGRRRALQRHSSHRLLRCRLQCLRTRWCESAADCHESKAFRAGYAQLAKYGLSFDSWLLEPQLPELIVDLARAFPDTPVILDHVGTPLGSASYQGRREQRFPLWRDNMRKLAELPHVSVRKLGGLAMPFCNFSSFLQVPPASLQPNWPPNGNPTSRLASSCSARSAACLKATFPSILAAAPTGYCGMPLKYWRRITQLPRKPHYSAERPDKFTV